MNPVIALPQPVYFPKMKGRQSNEYEDGDGWQKVPNHSVGQHIQKVFE